MNLKKRHFAAHALKSSRMKFNLVRHYGFKLGKPLWRTCYNHHKRDKANQQQGGRAFVSVRYLEENKAELYKDWSRNHAPQLVDSKVPCKKTFYNYVKKMNIFKNPHRLTDLCEYCEKLRDLKITLPNSLRQFGYHQEPDTMIDLKQASNFIKAKQVEINQNNGDLTDVKKKFLNKILIFQFLSKIQ